MAADAQVYAAEAFSGVATGLLVAPLVAIVDQAIVSNASGRETLPQCMRRLGTQLITSPGSFVRLPAFRWVLGIYGSTYVVANTTQQYLSHTDYTNDEAANIKVAATAMTNLSLSAMKDRAFAKMFAVSAIQATRTVPLTSLALFAARDATTVAASFTAADTVAPWISNHSGMNMSASINAALLVTPLAAQMVNTPFYTLGLDLFNNQGKPAGRGMRMVSLYTPTLLARWARILPAFGIGGVANRYIRHAIVPQGNQPRPVNI